MSTYKDAIVASALLLSISVSLSSAGISGSNSQKGICTFEIPTQDLLSPESRHGANLRGNSSRVGYSVIQVCCSGYKKTSNSPLKCEPICESECQNAICTAPNLCECKQGYFKFSNGTCLPSCPFGCLNGICSVSGKCSCNYGYQLSFDGKFCTPYCTGGCGVGGICTAPHTCTCANGFSLNRKTNKCEYYCKGGCGLSTCIGPNICSCKPGYKFENNTCVPYCRKGCVHGECIAPNRCSCKLGWRLDGINKSLCKPYCSQGCLNADCIAPNTCACKKGYVRAQGQEGIYKCVASCPKGCQNGVCSMPNFCICNPGYVKLNKGSNICIKKY